MTAVLFISVLALSMISPVRESQVRVADTYTRLAPPPKAPSQVVLVLIDDQSLQEYGRWPWPRTLLAQLTNRLSEAGASAIGLDILLSESQSQQADDALSAALRASGRVVIVAKIASFPDGPRWVEPLPQFARFASVGHAQAVLDRDSICRRFPPQELTLDGPRWAFAIEVARRIAPQKTAAFLASYGISSVASASPTILATPDLIPIPFRRDGFRTLSAAAVLSQPDLHVIQGRPVLVGFGPSELGDRVATPLGGALPTPGVEVHAQILDAILTGRALHGLGFWSGVGLLLLLCVLVVWIFRRARGWLGFVWLVLIAAAIYAAGLAAYVLAERTPPVGMLLLAVVLGPLLVYGADFVTVERSISYQLRGLRSWLRTREVPLQKSEISWKLQLLQNLQTELGTLYELHNALLESTQDLVAIFDENGSLLLKNGAFIAACPLPPESLTLARFRDQLSPKQDAPLRENGSVLEGEASLGSELYALRLAPLSPTSISPRGGTILTMASLRTREERDRARAEALGFITHELRTPLTSIQGFAELMMQYPDSPSCAAAPETIARESKRLLALINSYLDVLRLDAGAKALQTSPLDVDELVRQVFDLLQPLATANRMRLVHRVAPRPAVVVGDASLIQGAILNLVSNAIKYGHAGTDVHVACAQQEREFVIAVGNRGEAIPLDQVPHLFDPHYRGPAVESTTPGWGLGLAFVKRIAEKHGGSVTVQSHAEGTTFEMRLPANPVAATPQAV